MDEVLDKQQLEGLTLIQSLGAPDFASGVDVNYYTKAELSIPEAIELLRKERGDFYIYPRSTLLYYLKTHDSQDIKAHMDCCGGEQPLYLAFSRQSKHFIETSNHNYSPDTPMSPTNFPTEADKSSTAYQFQKQLLLMKESGTTMKMYEVYY